MATGFGVHPDASARALIRTGGFEARSSARRAADHQTCILGNERHSLGSACAGYLAHPTEIVCKCPISTSDQKTWRTPRLDFRPFWSSSRLMPGG